MSDPPAADSESRAASGPTLRQVVEGFFDAELRRIDRIFEPPPDIGSAFRLLDPSSFDWKMEGRSHREWTTAEAERWSDGVLFAATMAERFSAVAPGHADAFRAFAVTLRTRADMGPSGPPHAAAGLPASPQEDH